MNLFYHFSMCLMALAVICCIYLGLVSNEMFFAAVFITLALSGIVVMLIGVELNKNEYRALAQIGNAPKGNKKDGEE